MAGRQELCPVWGVVERVGGGLPVGGLVVVVVVAARRLPVGSPG
jgi:hypothetical protein